MPHKRFNSCPAGPGGNGSNKRTRLANWDIQKDENLLGIIKEQQLQVKGVSALFSNETWPTIVEAFNDKTGLSYQRKHLENRWKVLKHLYRTYSSLINNKGWRWDPVRNVLMPRSPSEWSEIIAANPSYAKYKDKSFPQYIDMDFLCGKNIEIGQHATVESEADNLDADYNKNDTMDSETKLNLKNNAEPEKIDAALSSQYGADKLKPESMLNDHHHPTKQGNQAFTEELPPLTSLKQQQITSSASSSCWKGHDHMSDVWRLLVDSEQLNLEIEREIFYRGIGTRDILHKLLKFTNNTGIVALCVALKDEGNPNLPDVLNQLVEIEREHLKIDREILKREIAARPVVDSIEDCLEKLKKIESISIKAFVAVCEAIIDENRRCIFMNLSGPGLTAWINYQMLRQFRQLFGVGSPGNSPGQA